jgi:hypothetical protein
MYSARRTSDRQPAGVNPFEVQRSIFAADLEPSAKILLLVILDHAGYGKTRCTASNATLAKESRLGIRQAIYLLRGLEAAGWLAVERLGPTVNHGRVLRPGPLCTAVHTPSALGCRPPLKLAAQTLCTAVQTNDSETEKKNEFAGGFASPQEEKPEPQRFPAPPRPKQPTTMQNYNPPTPIESDPDPARTASLLSRGWRNWADPGQT